MGESELCRVQCLAVKPKLLQQFAVRLSGTAVDRVTEQRMTDRRHVHPDLVGAARFEPALDQRSVAQMLEPLPMCHCALPAISLDDRDLLPVGSRAGKRRIDSAFSL